MRKSKFRYGDHLKDVASEDILRFVEVGLCKVFDHVLLRGIVDKDIQSSKSNQGSVSTCDPMDY